MCGICGIVGTRLAADALRAASTAMLARIAHRGPDARQIRLFEPPALPRPVALGHARLAVLDLSDAGIQPMANHDATTWITFNGEIYNFRELRQELEERGIRFQTGTDTEVMLALYDAYGPSFVGMLQGMFAFALLDLKERRLLLARDPIGIKPLYYAALPGAFLFGSEIKAILGSGLYTPEVDRQATHDYFTFLYVPCPDTLFRGVKQLPAGSTLTLDLDEPEPVVERYWQVRRLEEIERASYNDLSQRLRELLDDCVRSQLVSDVPLGVFLSGGIDSTILTGLARRYEDSLKTFTVVFDGAEFAFYDERNRAAAVAKHLGTSHTELTAPLDDPLDLLDLGLHFDQPFGNPTYYLMQRLSHCARQHVTVALCGAGGDELFAGYPRYQAAQLARRIAWVPRSLLRLGGWSLGLLRDSYRGMGLRRAREFFAGLDDDPIRQFARWTYHLNEDEKRELLGGDSADGMLPSHRTLRRALDRSALSDPGNRLLHVDVQTFLVDNLLEYTDKMSMTVGLEVRVPLLDHRFVELSLNVPFAHKLRGRQSKRIFRDAFTDFFPPGLLAAPKRGFNVPLARWMTGSLDGYFEASRRPDHPLRHRLGSDIGRTWNDGLLSWPAIENLRAQLRDGKADTSYELFSILLYDLWWRKQIEPV